MGLCKSWEGRWVDGGGGGGGDGGGGGGGGGYGGGILDKHPSD